MRIPRALTLSMLTFLVLAQFNNCGNYSDTSADLSELAALDCDADCITPTLDNLQVRPNVPGGSGNEFVVPANLIDFNIGGECNEGGFPYNTIRWELYLNNAKVRDSGMLGIVANGNAHSTCVNGRFLIYVNLSAITEDNVNRTGLSTGGANRGTYDLYIEVYGQNEFNGPAQRNQQKARTKISLLPI